MKQTLLLSKKPDRPLQNISQKELAEISSGPFCAINPDKNSAVLKSGAVTSAFMSAFL